MITYQPKSCQSDKVEGKLSEGHSGQKNFKKIKINKLSEGRVCGV